MRARISGGLFVLSALLFTMDPLAGQPGGGKDGKRSFQFQPGGGFGQPPGGTPGGGGFQGGGGYQGGGYQPGGGGFQGGSYQGGGGFQGSGMRMQFQPGGGGFQGGGMQPGGGGFQGGGGGFGRGGGGMDPETQWQMMLRLTGGTDTVDWGRVPPDTRTMLKGMSERMGTQPIPDSGVWNKAQFIDFATRNQELVRAKMAGGQPGAAPGAFAPPGGQPPFGQPGNFQMQPGQFGGPGFGGGGKGGMSEEDAVRRFKEADRDQDGRLSWDEASSRTRENWAEIDVNQDRYVDLDEYRAYIARRFGPNAQQQGGPPQYGMQPQYGNDFRGTGEGGGYPGQGGFGGPGRREEKKDDFTNVGIRYGKLPPGLPDWFAEYDTDKDGQINMYEWRTVGGKSVAEFRELDANGDGFIAPLELIRVTNVKAEYDRLMAIQDGETPTSGSGRGKGGSMSGGGKGGFPGFGGSGGGPPMMGKGGPPSADGSDRTDRTDRSDRTERTKGGEKMDRGKNNPFANGGKK